MSHDFVITHTYSFLKVDCIKLNLRNEKIDLRTYVSVFRRNKRRNIICTERPSVSQIYLNLLNSL